ncbi:electron transfer flavoprotein subunit beta/FixA family protein [Thermodesulfobacteriota bacterium]
MEIVVLLKQVPATESLIEIAADGLSIKTDDIKWIMNPYDEFAVEEALQIREKHDGSVTVLSVGSQQTIEAIRTALAMGADKGILIDDPAVEKCDALGIAKIIAATLQDVPFDVIIAGQRAVDDDNFQVAQAVAEFLKIPQISMVIKEEIVAGKIKCQRTIEGGMVLLEAPLPALFTTQRGLNEPRYASLPGIMKAKKKPLNIKAITDLGLDAASDLQPLSRIKALKPPPERKGGRIIEGESAQAKVAELVRALQEEAKAI